MCLLFVYLNESAGPGEYKFILANNRDEFYHRPAKATHFWTPEMNIIGGTDQEKGKEGGTWLAMNRNGKLACVLNILQPASDISPDKKGRGFLVNDFVKGNSSPRKYLEQLEKESSEYNGFLLVTMDIFPQCPSVSFYTNRSDDHTQSVTSGIHVFGNSSPKRLWEKAAQGKIKFTEALNKCCKKNEKEQLINELLLVLKDPTTYPVDEQMQSQGKGLPQYVLEKKNAAFYAIPEINYGTRSHTIILVDGENNVEYLESCMEQPIDIKGEVKWVNVREKFSLERNKD